MEKKKKNLHFNEFPSLRNCSKRASLACEIIRERQGALSQSWEKK